MAKGGKKKLSEDYRLGFSAVFRDNEEEIVEAEKAIEYTKKTGDGFLDYWRGQRDARLKCQKAMLGTMASIQEEENADDNSGQ